MSRNKFELHDPCAEATHPDIPCTVKGEIEVDDCTVTLRFEGHSSCDHPEGNGEILAVEYYGGVVRVHIYSDITVHGPTDSIPMDGARTERRDR